MGELHAHLHKMDRTRYAGKNMKRIDMLLNSITMYRLVLYILIALHAAAITLSILGVLPHNPLSILASAVFLVCVSWGMNTVFARLYNVPTNVESVHISALILSLLMTPTGNLQQFGFLFLAAILMVTSKFVFAFNGKHVFNPVAFAVYAMSVAFGHPASWWVSTAALFPFVLAGGLLILRKIRRFPMVSSFAAISIGVVASVSALRGNDILAVLQNFILETPWVFFACVMLTEPLTTPPTKGKRVFYGGLTGLAFASPMVFITTFSIQPELALLIGNIASYLLSPKGRLRLRFLEKVQLSPNLYDFMFAAHKPFSFHPGQYLEWTLKHKHPDSRGNRRFFTIASSPAEPYLRVGVRFSKTSSSYKTSLLNLRVGDEIVASAPAGDFTLPKDRRKKLVFIAGGIGITPFRSMVKHLLDTNERRSVTLLYSNGYAEDIMYSDVFESARTTLGIQTLYVLTKEQQLPKGKQYRKGHISTGMIRREVPDYAECMFYLSGTHGMVTAFQRTLTDMGVPREHIITDYFPGYT